MFMYRSRVTMTMPTCPTSTSTMQMHSMHSMSHQSVLGRHQLVLGCHQSDMRHCKCKCDHPCLQWLCPPIVRPLALVAPTLAPRPKPRPRMVAPPVRSSLAGRARPPRPSCKEDFIMLGISDGSKPDDPYGNRKALASSSRHSDKLETWDSLHQKWEKQKASSQPSRLSPNDESETSDDEDGNTKDLVIQETQDVLRRYLGDRSHKRWSCPHPGQSRGLY